MPEQSKLGQRAASAIASLGLSEKQQKRLQLNKLPRVYDFVNEFSMACPTCEKFLQESDELLQLLPHITSDKTAARELRKLLRAILTHLQQKHKIVPEGYYSSLYLAMGVGVGTALMAAADSPAFIAVGIAIGVAIGQGQEKKAKDEGRIL